MSKDLMLNAEEEHYLRTNPTIKVCVDPDWLPYEKLDANGRYTGLVAEYIDFFANKLQVKFEILNSDSWEETQNLYKEGKCDLVSALNKTSVREEHLVFTEPYITSPAVLVIKTNEQAKQLADYNGRKLAMVKGYVYDEKIRKQYPGIQIIYSQNMSEAISKVSNGEADATIAPLFLAFSLLQEANSGVANLTISGNSGYQDELRFGVTNNNDFLANILNKAVYSLTEDDHVFLKKKWSDERKKLN